MSGIGDNSKSNFSDFLKKAVESIEEETEEILESIEEEKEELLQNVKEEIVTKAEIPIEKPKKEVLITGEPVSELGLISTTTTITGTLSSKGHVKIEGHIVGDVTTYGDIKVTGTVKGDMDGSNIELEGCDIIGNIKANGDISVGKDSILKGDVKGQFITIDGRIEGNIDALKGAHMSDTSALKGSIAAPTLSMSSGAEIQGKVNVSKEDVE